MSELDGFYLNQAEPNKSCFLELRKIILSIHKDVSETRKYGMPCFTYRKKMFCYLWSDKKTEEPYLLMVEGKHLDHPDLESGSRARMKILPINPKKDIPIRKVKSILNSAIQLYIDGIVKI